MWKMLPTAYAAAAKETLFLQLSVPVNASCKSCVSLPILPSLFLPAGACRQVMNEFKIGKILLGNLEGDIISCTVKDLLPYGFTL